MRKVMLAVVVVVCGYFIGFSVYAGVAKIEKNGTSSTGEQIYKITCTNGNTMRYWWSDGQWYSALGEVGMRSYSLQELAEDRCQ